MAIKKVSESGSKARVQEQLNPKPGVIKTKRSAISVGKHEPGDLEGFLLVTGSQVTGGQGFKQGDRVRLTVSHELEGRTVAKSVYKQVKKKSVGEGQGAHEYLVVDGIPAEKLPELKLKHADYVNLKIEKV
jgi:hypothetical protein